MPKQWTGSQACTQPAFAHYCPVGMGGPSVLQADKLSGEWKLVYTSGSELSALLALSKLPFVTVGDITQTIDGAAGTVVNKVGCPASRVAHGHAHFSRFYY